MTDRSSDTVLDEYLVSGAQAGDREALADLVTRWNPRFLKLAMHLTHNPEASRDIAQESWVAVVRGLRSLNDPARFRSWALRIVSNKARDWIRREQARRGALAKASHESAGRTPAVVVDDRLPAVRRAMEELEPRQRLVLSLYYVEGMPVAEIADALGIPSGTVKSRLFHARAALRAALQEVSA